MAFALSSRGCGASTRAWGRPTGDAGRRGRAQSSPALALFSRDNLASNVVRRQSDDARDVSVQARRGFSKKRKGAAENEGCPCGSGVSYDDCCRPYHLGTKVAETPLELLKSRFTAYAKGVSQYVEDTTHADNEILNGSKNELGQVVSSFQEDIKATCAKVNFSNLRVHMEEAGKPPKDGEEETAAIVFQYDATIVGQKGWRKGNTDTVTERSVFARSADDGRWRFIDGVTKFDADIVPGKDAERLKKEAERLQKEENEAKSR
mmetsp:Transcript_16825/g.55037  ORF Transcript_16825/g.55037 Transcript_16825/m.55037 type:complete len:263 (-) Transcript_16825:105-893(-)